MSDKASAISDYYHESIYYWIYWWAVVKFYITNEIEGLLILRISNKNNLNCKAEKLWKLNILLTEQTYSLSSLLRFVVLGEPRIRCNFLNSYHDVKLYQPYHNFSIMHPSVRQPWSKVTWFGKLIEKLPHVLMNHISQRSKTKFTNRSQNCYYPYTILDSSTPSAYFSLFIICTLKK